MTKLRRYSPDLGSGPDYCARMEEDEFGDYVKLEDYERLRAALEKIVSERTPSSYTARQALGLQSEPPGQS